MTVHVRVLGRPVATSPAGIQAIERKAAACVCYLVIEGRQSRDKIADLLWPAAARGTARSNLRQLARRLRRAAGGAEILTGSDPMEIAPGVEVDVQLLLACATVDDWFRVVACSGELLAGLWRSEFRAVAPPERFLQGVLFAGYLTHLARNRSSDACL